MSKKLSGTIAVVALCVIGIVLLLIVTPSDAYFEDYATNAIRIALLAVISVYTIWDYKVPHGNTLKYVMLAFALSLNVTLYSCCLRGDEECLILTGVSMVLIAYMSGRLHKVRLNIVLSAAVFLLLAAQSVVSISSLPSAAFLKDLGLSPAGAIVRSLMDLLTWFALFLSYLTCFSGHLTAGQKEKST